MAARIVSSRLTEDQYNNPASYSPDINFPTNSEGHPYSIISYEEITPDTPISLQQCSCKLAEQTDKLKLWVISGNPTCMLCRDFLNISDLHTTAEKLNRFIMRSLVVSVTLLTMLSILYFNGDAYTQQSARMDEELEILRLFKIR